MRCDQIEQAREDAKWMRSRARKRRDSAEGSRYETVAALEDRLAGYAEEYVRLVEGLRERRDSLVFDAGQSREMLCCAESDEEYRDGERDAEKADEWAAELTALLGESEGGK